jgi:hypothetical protein
VVEELEVAALEEATGSGTAFRVVRPREEGSGIGPREATKRTPMVGREQEVGLLLDRWGKAREGQGQGVLVSGEAGMGKSRLVEVLRERLADEPHSWIDLRGSAYHQNSAFYPVSPPKTYRRNRSRAWSGGSSRQDFP